MVVKRLSLVAVLTIGLILVVFPIASNLFGKTIAVEHVTGDFRSTFTQKSLAQTRADLNGVVAMSDQLQKQTLPALPPALGMSPEQFQSFLGSNFPDVATGVSQLNTILPRFEGLVGGLESQRSNFDKADSIPTGFLPSTIVPYLFLVPGALLVVLAGIGLARVNPHPREKSSFVALIAALVVGVVLAGAALGLSVHAKAKAVDDLTAALGPAFTTAGAAQTRTDMDTVQAMADQLQKETLPALAKALKMSDTEFGAFMTKNFPDVAKGVTQLDTVLPRFQADVTAISDNVSDFHKVSSIPTEGSPTTALFWWFVIPGVVLIVISGAALAARRSANAAA